MELFGGQFLPVRVALCVQAARVYVPPLFLVSRESMHNPPTIHRYHYLSASLRFFVHPSLSNPSFVRPLSTLSILSLCLSFYHPRSTRSLFFISKILSIRANKLHSLNSTLGSAVRKIKRFSVRLPAKEWTRE